MKGYRFREELASIEIPPHGGKRDVEIDMSTCLNPLGPPPGIYEEIERIKGEIEIYPDSESLELREAIAKKRKLDKNQILIGNGASELIFLVCLSFLNKGDIVLIPKPTYGEYEVSSKLCGGKTKFYPLKGDNFRISPDFADEIRKNSPKLVFLCNPNNPTGEYLREKELLDILRACEEVESVLVIDEAYSDFVLDPINSDFLLDREVILIRSMTKSYAIPGIRIGYLAGCEDFVREIRKAKIPWNTNSFAQKIGVFCLENDEYLEETRKLVSREKRYIHKELSELPVRIIPSETNYMLIDLGKISARRLNEALKNHGIYVRDCSSFGLPNFIRIGIQNHEKNAKFVSVIKKIINGDLKSHSGVVTSQDP
ncbi:MAG: pyridoxal phosphate-dependent aminotransferase [Candidatus Syntropharchaeia archaeon]